MPGARGEEVMRGFRRILVALDGSREILAPGLQLAGDEGCWTTVLKVMPENEGDLELTGIKDIDSVLTGEERQVRAAVRQSADDARVLVKSRVEEGGISERIVAVAAEERCDLIGHCAVPGAGSLASLLQVGPGFPELADPTTRS
jgi:nucleotide-binding universal stress UspA family protein